MNGAKRAAPERRRIAALLAVALILVVPATWMAWSLNSVAVLDETMRSQSTLLRGLRSRLAALEPGKGVPGEVGDVESVFLPGGTAAIAGAALQRIVAQAVEGVGGRLIESEVVRVETAEEEPGRIDLRVSFDTEIVSLQQVLFEIETGVPILVVRSLTVQSGTVGNVVDTESPPLRVVILVSGYQEIPA
jgi:hypothetical protein